MIEQQFRIVAPEGAFTIWAPDIDAARQLVRDVAPERDDIRVEATTVVRVPRALLGRAFEYYGLGL